MLQIHILLGIATAVFGISRTAQMILFDDDPYAAGVSGTSTSKSECDGTLGVRHETAVGEAILQHLQNFVRFAHLLREAVYHRAPELKNRPSSLQVPPSCLPLSSRFIGHKGDLCPSRPDLGATRQG